MTLRGLGTAGTGGDQRAVAPVDPRHLGDPGERRRHRSDERRRLGDQPAPRRGGRDPALREGDRRQRHPRAARRLRPGRPLRDDRRRRPLPLRQRRPRSSSSSPCRTRAPRRLLRRRPAPSRSIRAPPRSASTPPGRSSPTATSSVEDTLNTWEPTTANRHKVRVYPLKSASGVHGAEHLRHRHRGAHGRLRLPGRRLHRPEREACDRRRRTAGDHSRAPELVFSGVKGTTSPIADASSSRTSATSRSRSSSSVTLTGAERGDFTIVAADTSRRSSIAGETATFDVRFAPGATVIGLPCRRLSTRLERRRRRGDTRRRASTASRRTASRATTSRRSSRSWTRSAIRSTSAAPVSILGNGATPIGDEVRAPLFQKAGTGTVTIKPVARYSPDEALPFGYVHAAGGATRLHNEVATIALDQEQTLNPTHRRAARRASTRARSRFGLYVDSDLVRPQELHAGRPQHRRRARRPHVPGQGPRRAADRRTPTSSRSRTQHGRLPGLRLRGHQRHAGPPASAGNVAQDRLPARRSDRSRRLHPDAGLGSTRPAASAGSTPGTSTPIDMSARPASGTSPTDQRLDTLILMQGTAAPTRNAGAWEYALPNGIYDVTRDRRRRLVHGSHPPGHRRGRERHQRLRADDRRTSSRARPSTVTVTDGRLTLDATGGTNTKLTYVDIVRYPT